MNWIKKGLIFKPNAEFDWNKSHAQVPVVDVLDNKLRIYYATRNSQGQSNTSFIEVDKYNPTRILYIHNKPIFNLGKPGTFDDSGIMPSCIINQGSKKLLYYIGWTKRYSVPFHNAIGLAISNDGGITFNKLGGGPIITTNYIEPYFSGTSYVLQDLSLYKMWYLSCIGWLMDQAIPEPIYHIKYAESIDGINWIQTGSVAIELKEDEGGLASAAVIQENSTYKMWFARRKKIDYRENPKNSYKIGYAESIDGKEWLRKDDLAGIEPSTQGWDSKMISYPYIVRVDQKLMMFYNGNGFGETGFGYAVLE